MIRLGVSVEGKTERRFVDSLLREHLLRWEVAVTAIDIRGNVSLDKVRGVLPPLLGSFDVVSTLYDLYGFKGRDGRDAAAVEAAILDLAAGAERARLIPYVQQYEFEALLFAAPRQMVEWLEGDESDLKAMYAAIRQCGSPETINDSRETSPSHRLRNLFGGHYDKPLHGPEILELAGLPAIRAHCPRFDAWVARLEGLGARP